MTTPDQVRVTNVGDLDVFSDAANNVATAIRDGLPEFSIWQALEEWARSANLDPAPFCTQFELGNPTLDVLAAYGAILVASDELAAYMMGGEAQRALFAVVADDDEKLQALVAGMEWAVEGPIVIEDVRRALGESLVRALRLTQM